MRRQERMASRAQGEELIFIEREKHLSPHQEVEALLWGEPPGSTLWAGLAPGRRIYSLTVAESRKINGGL